MQLRAAGSSHIGVKRKQNQDSFLVDEKLGLFVVADGMGGHKGGETAALLAVQTILESVKEEHNLPRAIARANAAINAKGREDARLAGMGTTATVLLFTDSGAQIAQVGDSRAYLVHPGRIWQLTCDHSLVQEKLRAGLITRAQLKTDQMKNVITRSVGFEEEVETDLFDLEARPGDVFLLCSDGLSGMIEDQNIRDLVTEAVFHYGSLDIGVRRLIDAANAAGGVDNITVILVQVEEGSA